MMIEKGGGMRKAGANMQGIHDNPANSNCQAVSHWKSVESKILTTYLPCQEGWAAARKKRVMTSKAEL